jgi:pseudaminic acid cytidylyltransferase
LNIAIIPARGGSKRIPRKNIKLFAGKPMIAYAIETAKNSNLFEKIIVSTDDLEIAEIATKYRAEVPFIRPPELANDFAGTVPVIAHAISFCQNLGWKIENACCIYPCTPLMEFEDLKKAFEQLKSKNVDFVFPVCEFPSAIQRALKQNLNGTMEPFYPQFEQTRTQDLEKAYHDAGQFYFGKADAWTQEKKIHSGGIGLLIPSWLAVDIDTPEDWERAESIYKSLKV